MSDVVYVVIIESEDGDGNQVHGVYSSEEKAEEVVQELSSRISDMICYLEEHEVV